ncbi:MAG TPA: hypothetical protein VD993_17815 [Chitinophagaceae bacterium]|nr:hypothetical protein [Chitinophagaceae bacterium]
MKKEKLKKIKLSGLQQQVDKSRLVKTTGAGKWGSVNPRTGECGGIEMADCGGWTY